MELIEEEQPRFPSGAVYLVKIRLGRSALQERLKMAGTPLASGSKALETTGTVTRRPGLEERVVTRLELT